MWQVVTGCLPSCQRLTDRHIGSDQSCPRCGSVSETLNHLFFECPPARQVWAISPIPSPLGVFPTESIYVNIDHLFWRAKEMGCDEEALLIFPWLLWYIWKASNQKIFESKEVNLNVTLQLAVLEAKAFKKAVSSSSSNDCLTVHHDAGAAYALIPDPGGLSCLIDGSWSASDPWCGQGWLVRYEDRTIHLGLGGVRRCLSPLHSEIQALLWAMQCLKDLAMPHVSFFTDCKDTISIMEHQDLWPSFASEIDDFNYLKPFFFFFFYWLFVA